MADWTPWTPFKEIPSRYDGLAIRGATRAGLDVDDDSYGPDLKSTGSPNVYTNACPQVRVGDVDNDDPDMMVTGSPTVITNRRMTCRIGDVDNDGPDTTVTGSPNVFIGDHSFTVTTIQIPPNPKPKPLTRAEQQQVIISRQITLASPECREAGITAGEAPVRPDAETVNPKTEEPVKPDDPLPPSDDDCSKKLAAAIESSTSKDWKESGSNSNIEAAYSAVGVPQSGDQTAWCAAYTGAMLKESGLPYKKSLSSLNYQGYGTSVPINDPSQWRKNDIIVFKRPGGGHVGFIQAVSPGDKVVSVLGGNQGHTLKVSNFQSSWYDNIAYIGRPCPKSDVPVVTSHISASPKKITVT